MKIFAIAMLFLSVSFVQAQNKAEDYYRQGELKSSFFDEEGAITEYKKALAIDTAHALSNYKIGLILFNKKDYSASVKYLNNYIRYENNNAEALYIRGKAKMEQEDIKGAIADFDKSLNVNSKNVRVLYNRGLARYKSGDFNGAVQDFDATVIVPKTKNSPRIEFADAYFNRGLAKEKLGKKDEACADWKKASELGSAEGEKRITNVCK
jgi:tetratricopeptide (TPR) repeat protein